MCRPLGGIPESIGVNMRVLPLLPVFLVACLAQGCATFFDGYYDTVELTNAPDSLRVYTAQGVEIPVKRDSMRAQPRLLFRSPETRLVTRIQLRSNLDPVLVLRSGEQEKRVQVFGKIQAGWLILDMVLVGPLVVDAITGNWNSYDPIDASFK
jgi:hypothetical protein